MSSTTHMQHRTDAAIKDDVEHELEWTPGIVATTIGVAVSDGVVTLTGRVADHTERVQVGRAALRVAGVRAIADELTIHTGTAPRTDGEIASAVRAALDADGAVPTADIRVEVSNRVVILEGTVRWYFQRLAAIRDAERVAGVSYVLSRIDLTPRPSAPDTERRIREAFVRSAALDADRIDVKVEGTVVTLQGRVRTWAERREAENAAWRSPHVTDIRNEILVEP
ncbi:BON domain-containing protein [Curtobacterium ammoniigenes]|uniref:BON domain-containing protein n=1 Tax=Curtobacterium ammoniigenes TaxID=395387 RepID=UPI00082F3FEF|nr:BON domain-containing protein [Curtobacterium ammoniigenes]